MSAKKLKFLVDTIWNEVCKLAVVGNHTPRGARHAIKHHFIEKTAISQRFNVSAATPMRPNRFSTPGSPTKIWSIPFL